MVAKERSELDRLSPGERYRLKDGEEIEVYPLRLKQLRAFSASISSLFTVLEKSGVDDLTDPDSWPLLFETFLEEIAELMGIILEREKEWVMNLRPTDAIGIFTIIVDQNIDDLTKKNIMDLAEKFKKLFPTRSKASSPRDTVGTASSA